MKIYSDPEDCPHTGAEEGSECSLCGKFIADKESSSKEESDGFSTLEESSSEQLPDLGPWYEID
jgi:hypothetical protein